MKRIFSEQAKNENIIYNSPYPKRFHLQIAKRYWQIKDDSTSHNQPTLYVWMSAVYLSVSKFFIRFTSDASGCCFRCHLCPMSLRKHGIQARNEPLLRHQKNTPPELRERNKQFFFGWMLLATVVKIRSKYIQNYNKTW